MTGAFGFLLANALLNEVLCGADGIGRTADRHPTVACPRCINPLFRYLDIGPAKMLNLQQGFTTRPQNRSHNVLPHLQLSPKSIHTQLTLNYALNFVIHVFYDDRKSNKVLHKSIQLSINKYIFLEIN